MSLRVICLVVYGKEFIFIFLPKIERLGLVSFSKSSDEVIYLDNYYTDIKFSFLGVNFLCSFCSLCFGFLPPRLTVCFFVFLLPPSMPVTFGMFSFKKNKALKHVSLYYIGGVSVH